MIKLTQKERDILDLLQDCTYKRLMLSKGYKGALKDLIEKEYILKKGRFYKLNWDGK